jgi:hypothetical protein
MTAWTDVLEQSNGAFVDEDDFNALVNNIKNVYERIDVLEATRGGGAPVGSVALWPRALSLVPVGWQVCDGSNGTPDLRKKMLLGLADGEDDDDLLVSGGSDTHYHTNPNANSNGSHGHSTGSVVTTYGGTVARQETAGTSCSDHNHAHWVTPGIAVGGSHEHAIGNNIAVENKPPHRKLYYIMRMAS